MAPTPRDDARIVGEWRACWRRLEKNGSLDQACRELARAYHCAAATVRYHLDDSYRHSDLTRARRRVRKPRRQIDPIKRKNRQKRFERNYRRITRPTSQRRLLNALYTDGTDTLTFNDIAERLPQHLDKVEFGEQVIQRRFLDAFIARQRDGEPPIRGPPWLVKLSDNHYRYSDRRPKD